MIPNIELTILKGLINNETYTRKVLPYVKDVYFETPESNLLFDICKKHFTKYDSTATLESIAVDIENLNGISSTVFESLGVLYDSLNTKEDGEASSTSDATRTTTTNLEWLIDTTENWCKQRAIHLALLESITIHDKGENKDSIPQLLSDALSVSFDDHIGHNYLGDYEERYDFYHRKEEKLSFGIEYFDKITKGGMPNKTLNIALAGTGTGKSLCMCSVASSILMAGKNVLYITLEMAEERIAERIDANLLNVNVQDIDEIPKPIFENKVLAIQKKTRGELFIKEYPTASAHAGHFDALIKELAIKKSFKPDIIFVDYLNICLSQRYTSGASINSYTVVKAIAEELRGLAVKYNVPVFSATQTTRGGFASSDPTLTDTSESFGLPATADFMFALIATDDLDAMGQIMVKQLKNRYNDATTNRKFVVGIDRSKMRLFDVEQGAQAGVADIEITETFKANTDKFASFSF